MLRLIIFMIAALSATSAAAQTPVAAAEMPVAECRVRINAAPASWIIEGHDPFSGAAAEGTFSVTFTNEGGADCLFSPVFSTQQPPFGLSRGSGKPIAYAILNLTDTQDVTPRSGRSLRSISYREIALQSKESRSVLYKLVADTSEVMAVGTFTQDVTIEAMDKQFRSYGGTSLVLGLTVLPSARVGLAGAYTVDNGLAVVNLGELKEGIAPVPLQLRISSTGTYDISVSSANSGHLRLGSSDWSVPYSMSIGRTSVNLSGVQTVAGRNGSGARLDTLPVRFVIGDVSNKRAGSYSDIVSISVTAR